MKKSISVLILSVLFSFTANAFQRYGCTAIMDPGKDRIVPLSVATACDAAVSNTSADFVITPSSAHTQKNFKSK